MYQPLWQNFNLLTEGRTMQIWGPSNWKIRCPFSGEGHTITPHDIAEGNPRWRYPRTFHQVYINYHQDDQADILNTDEELEENEEQNIGENIAKDKEDPENDIHYEDDNHEENNDEGDSKDDVAEDRRDFYHRM